jgi:hypothetical protein
MWPAWDGFHLGIGLLRGFRQVQSDRSPRAERAFDSNVPPGLSDKAIDHAGPSPVPLPTSLVVKKGSKTRSRISGGIPQPVSVTDTSTYDPGKHPATAPSSRTTFRVSISSTPPSGMASRAFRAKLRRALLPEHLFERCSQRTNPG